MADGIVQCGNAGQSACTFNDFLEMLTRIYGVIINIATPLAIIAVTAGAIMMMISAGDPSRMTLGKTIFWSAIIGLFLVFTSKAIINLVLSSMGIATIQ